MSMKLERGIIVNEKKKLSFDDGLCYGFTAGVIVITLIVITSVGVA